MNKKATTKKQPQFGIQRIYLLDSSFEISSEEVFKQEWKPDVQLDLNSTHKDLGDSSYQVTLHVNVTVKLDNEVAFIVEIKQAGIFFIEGFPQDQLQRLLGAYCPEVLFPYARETIANSITRGSFPPLHLAPINFEALYEQQLKQKQEQEQNAT